MAELLSVEELMSALAVALTKTDRRALHHGGRLVYPEWYVKLRADMDEHVAAHHPGCKRQRSPSPKRCRRGNGAFDHP